MTQKYIYNCSILLLFALLSCKNNTSLAKATYFGGEIENPKSKFVILLKDNTVLDTLFLDKNNRFSKKFEKFESGLYSFKHEPEFQYVYIEENDSVMCKLNTNDFDNSLVFCGKGGEKNNFLMELFLNDLQDKNTLFELYEKPLNIFENFMKTCEKRNNGIYQKRKEVYKWSDEFDEFVQGSMAYNLAYKKELYPLVHEFKTGKNITQSLPKNYYSYRENLNLNNPKMSYYMPFVNYVTVMLNNICSTKTKTRMNDMSIETNIKKLHIADSLIQNQTVKNFVAHNIAQMYLLSDQCSKSNEQFFSLYEKISKDKKLNKEIMQTASQIKNLQAGKELPNIELVNLDGEKTSIKQHLNKKTIIYFWTKQSDSHAIYSHKKALDLQKKYKDLQCISININNTHDDWKKMIVDKNFKNAIHLRAENLSELKEKWIINRVYRTMIINKTGTVNNAFVSLFDANFENHLN